MYAKKVSNCNIAQVSSKKLNVLAGGGGGGGGRMLQIEEDEKGITINAMHGY